MLQLTVEINLTKDEAEAFERYLDDNCFDRDKWVKRIVSQGIYNSVGRWKQPKGTVSPKFKLKPETTKAKKPK